MATIAWTDEARQWLEDIFEYIAADNPPAAVRTIQGVYERAQILATFPEIGQRYQVSSRNVRVLLYGHYRIAYLVKDDGNIDILGVFTVRSTLRDISYECHITARSTATRGKRGARLRVRVIADVSRLNMRRA